MPLNNINKKRMPSFSKGKAKNLKYTIKKLLNSLSKQKGALLISLLLNVISNLFALFAPFITGQLMNELDKKEGAIDFYQVYKYASIMLCFFLLSSLLSFIIQVIMIKVSKKLVFQMRKEAYENLINLPIYYFDSSTTGEIISILSYDVDAVNTSLSNDLIMMITSVITIIGSFVMMVLVSKILVLVFVITVPLSILFTKIMVKKTATYFKDRSIKLGKLSGFSEEMITGIMTIKANGKENEVIQSFDKVNKEAAQASYMAEYYSAYTGPGVNFVNNISLSLISFLGAILYVFEKIKLGDISSFVLYSKKFSGPLNELANIVTDIESALASAERVYHLIDETKEFSDAKNAKPLEKFAGKVEFKHVYFGYHSNKLVLKDISFIAYPGEKIAIVGPTGSGKTTIVNLLMRFYEPSSGSIMLDDNFLASYKKHDVRTSFAMVLQESWLFEGTIYENLIYGNPFVTKEEVIKACKDSYIYDFIESLPLGFDTILKDGGTKISKGQKQLLTIARAMLIPSKLLILDEATSSVDTKTEVAIRKAMERLTNNKTSFIIAHRLSTIVNADKILVIKDGYLIEEGNHETLVHKHGFYDELYHSSK